MVPTAEWWAQNCFNINRFWLAAPFCGFESHYERHWSLIRKLYSWLSKLGHPYFNQQASTSEKKTLFVLFSEIRGMMAEMDPKSETVIALEKRVDFELERVDVLLQELGWPTKPIYSATHPQISFIDAMATDVIWFWEYLKSVRLRHRRRQPLIFECAPSVPESNALKPAYLRVWKVRRMIKEAHIKSTQ